VACPAAQAAIDSVVAGGKVVSVGMGCDHAHLPISTINCKEIDLMGSFRYVNTVRPPCLKVACMACLLLLLPLRKSHPPVLPELQRGATQLPCHLVQYFSGCKVLPGAVA
jgi:threonine dehydrogenase-like Zn-dependent dehydrogenase